MADATAKRYDVAVLGATGAVGAAMIELLEARDFPIGTLYPLASERSAGQRIEFHGKHLPVLDAASFDFGRVQIALFSAGATVSAELAPRAAAAGCVVIDNSAAFRDAPDVPLVIPEVNPEALAGYRARNIVANPNCSTIQLLVALKPLHDAAGITRINVATYQAVSGSGRAAIRELAGQTASLLNGQPAVAKVYPKQIAFNVLPQIDAFEANGYTREEMKMVRETQKILASPDILVNPTAVRVPVFYGHAEAVHIETAAKLGAAQARDLLRAAPGVELLDETCAGAWPTPVTDSARHDAVFVGRVREDISHPQGLDLWIVADNVRKGAALNSLQIAELLIKAHF